MGWCINHVSLKLAKNSPLPPVFHFYPHWVSPSPFTADVSRGRLLPTLHCAMCSTADSHHAPASSHCHCHNEKHSSSVQSRQFFCSLLLFCAEIPPLSLFDFAHILLNDSTVVRTSCMEVFVASWRYDPVFDTQILLWTNIAQV